MDDGMLMSNFWLSFWDRFVYNLNNQNVCSIFRSVSTLSFAVNHHFCQQNSQQKSLKWVYGKFQQQWPYQAWQMDETHIFQFAEDLCAAGSTGVATCGVNGCTCTSEELEEFWGILGILLRSPKKLMTCTSEIYDTWYCKWRKWLKVKNAQLNSWMYYLRFFLFTFLAPLWDRNGNSANGLAESDSAMLVGLTPNNWWWCFQSFFF